LIIILNRGFILDNRTKALKDAPSPNPAFKVLFDRHQVPYDLRIHTESKADLVKEFIFTPQFPRLDDIFARYSKSYLTPMLC